MQKVVVWVMAAVCALLLATRASAEQAPRIEVAFAMDATGSMGPYIEQARARIGQIAESLAQGNLGPSRDVTAVQAFAGSIWVGTRGGLARAVRLSTP